MPVEFLYISIMSTALCGFNTGQPVCIPAYTSAGNTAAAGLYSDSETKW